MLKLAQYPRNADNSPMDVMVGVLTDASGNGGARLTTPPVGPDGSSIDVKSILLVDQAGNPVSVGGAAPTTLFVDLISATIPAGTDIIRSSGYRVPGLGAAYYVADASVNVLNVGTYPRVMFMNGGRGWRLDTSNGVEFYQFGAHNDNAVTDDYPTHQAVVAYFNWLADNGKIPYWDAYNGVYRPFPTLRINVGHYRSSATLEYDGGTWDVICEKVFAPNGGYGAAFKIDPGNDGVVVQSYNTTGVNGAKTSRAAAYGALGSHFRNLFVYTTGAGGYAAACGFYVRATAHFENCGAYNFPSHGHCWAGTAGAGGAAEGNCNGGTLRGGVYKSNGGCGIRSVGADANAITIDAALTDNNALFGYDDSSFLGTFPTHLLGQTNGIMGAGPSYAPIAQAGTCSDGTYRYYLLYGQDANATATAPTLGANNAVWKLIGPGAADGYRYPLYAGGLTWKAGGAGVVSQPTAQTVFRDCYGESDNGPAQMLASGFWDGGLGGCLVFGAFAQQGSTHGRVVSGSRVGTVVYSWQNGDVYSSRGSSDPTGVVTRISGFSSSTWDNVNGEHQFVYNSFYKDILYQREAGGNYLWRETTDQTIFNPGRSATVPKALIYPSIFLGSDNAARELIGGANTAPAAGAHGVGDLAVMNGPSPATPVTLRTCTVAGTPGTFKAAASIAVKDVTANRPALGANDGGVMYFDTTLVAAGKPIWWTGTQWVDATGAVV